MDADTVKKYLPQEQVRDQLVSKKAVAVVVDSATAEKPKKAPAKKAAKKSADEGAGKAEEKETTEADGKEAE